jgi:hypothetical protein
VATKKEVLKLLKEKPVESAQKSKPYVKDPKFEKWLKAATSTKNQW